MKEHKGPFEAHDPSDRSVVERIMAGERESYRILVRRYQDLLYRHALRMTGDGDVAEDLVQASFVKAYTSLASCRELDRFGAWLFRILVNACKDHLKSRRRRDVSLDEEMVQPVDPATPQTELERGEAGAQLQRALLRIPEAMREAFVLKHVEGRSYEEIASLMNTSVPALKMRVHRARELLKQLLTETK